MTSEEKLQKLRDAKMLVCDNDGFVKFFPGGSQGYYTPSELREIADHLDAVNAPWEADIERYFSKDD